MYLNKWIYNENNDSDYMVEGFSKIISLVLRSRGFIKKQDISNFINNNIIYSDPFNIKDMKKAVDRTKFAIDNDEKIVIYGDYDVDGITSTVILFSYLSDLGANVNFYIPSRDIDGYGLNIKSIDKLSNDYNLIITVDNGITAIDEVNYANNLGVDVIVTDHHKPLNELPNAIAVVDPHRKDCDSKYQSLAGVGVVFKLVSALEGNSEIILDKFADIICLGTIADVMPLVGENRNIIKAGFKKLKNNPNKGLQALINVCQENIDNISSMSISFKIAPRLNSASRMGKIDLAVNLLLSDSYYKSIEIVDELEKINNKRKKIENEMLEEINQMILDNPQIISSNIIVISKSGWNHSITGINASKLVEKYHKPCILISIDGELANGSGRSVEGLSLIDAISYCKDDFIKYGGHTLAVGFTIKTENINKFLNNINEYLKNFDDSLLIKRYNIDCEIEAKDITIKNIEDLSLLEPYGLGNETPLILIRNVTICNLINLSRGKYTKVIVTCIDGIRLELLAFNISYNDFLYNIGDIVDIIITLSLNNYNNIVSPAIILKDMRLSCFNQRKYFNDIKIYNKFKCLKNFDLDLIKNDIPVRDEMIIIYKYLKNMTDYTYVTLHDLIEYLFIKLSKYNFSYIKIGLILDILQEINVILLKSKIELLNVKTKVDIKSSQTYQKLLCLIN